LIPDALLEIPPLSGLNCRTPLELAKNAMLEPSGMVAVPVICPAEFSAYALLATVSGIE